MTHHHRRAFAPLLLVVGLLLAAACGSSEDGDDDSVDAGDETTTTAAEEEAPDGGGEERSFTAEVWADNWFSLYVDGELVGEDSVPITTERSFNAETIAFTAAYPFTVGMVTRDFIEDDSGLEYIGSERQQVGDGGFIAQITDDSTGEVVAATGDGWVGLVVHRAPLDLSCERSADPAADCESEVAEEPDGWADPGFDDSTWEAATVHDEAEVDPKEGYLEITWDDEASLIWSDDLQLDNTILWRVVVEEP